MQDHVSRQHRFRRQWLGLGLVVLLHALLLWALQSGLGRTVTRQAQVVVDAVLLSEDKPAPPPPAPPPRPTPAVTRTPAVPTVAPTVPAVTPAPNAVTMAPAAPPAAPQASPAGPVSPAAPAPRAEPVRTAAGVNAANCEKPEYPSASRRLEEEGTVHLRFLVGVDGKVIQSEIEKSSGYRRLDEAARAGLARCQFRPATVDGKPEQAWASIKYTWRLE